MEQSTSTQELAHTPLHEAHIALGAKMAPFAGFDMPVQYPSGITAEHNAVRTGCGLFDVSHMGEFEVRGPGAVDFVNYVTSNDVAALAVGQVQYSTILNERGTIEDDCLVYRFADRIMMVVNASNRAKDLEHIMRYADQFDCTVEDISQDVALLALQGPAAVSVLQALTGTELSAIGYYHFAEGKVANVPAVISRTGYTGEDGFELYFGAADARLLWDTLLATGKVTPAGLGSRDSLRLEMGMALYGNDIDDSTSPLEANLGWVVKLKKGDFVGRNALVRLKEQGIDRKLVGFTIADRVFPRHGYPVYYSGEKIGAVLSGTVSPSLGVAIGTCYLPRASAVEGTAFEVEIRGKRVQATVVKTPFYKQGSHL
jgi:aminomethyltransferase